MRRTLALAEASRIAERCELRALGRVKGSLVYERNLAESVLVRS
jgi:hypothetical protein